MEESAISWHRPFRLPAGGLFAGFLFPSRSLRAGKSFAEILVVIVGIGILATISIPMIVNTIPAVSGETAQANLAKLNQAVLAFGQVGWEMILDPQAGSSEDELLILRSVQHRDPSNPLPGSPFLSPFLVFTGTNDDSTFRAVWNGRMFELVEPGSAGEGIDLLTMEENLDSAFDFSGFTPVGGAP